MYLYDASKYDSLKRLKIRETYESIISNMGNKKKGMFLNKLPPKLKRRELSNYDDEFDYLVTSGIAIEVKAILEPRFPLISSSKRNLVKFYYNDSGLYTFLAFKNNVDPIFKDNRSINLGSLYETVVASELDRHKDHLFYYDNKEKGEVDFLIDDYDTEKVLPLEVKSGRDYQIHSTISNLLKDDLSIHYGYVLNNSNSIKVSKNIVYLPIYLVMFM